MYCSSAEQKNYQGPVMRVIIETKQRQYGDNHKSFVYVYVLLDMGRHFFCLLSLKRLCAVPHTFKCQYSCKTVIVLQSSIVGFSKDC